MTTMKRLVASLFALVLLLIATAVVAPTPVEAQCPIWCKPCSSGCKTHYCYMLTGTIEQVTDSSVALRVTGMTSGTGEVVHPELTGALLPIFNDADYIDRVGERVESDGHFLTTDNAAVILAPGGDHYLDAEGEKVAANRVSVVLHQPAPAATD